MSDTVDVKVFNDVIKNGVYVIDFFATWCQPCAMLHPIIEELEQEYAGKVNFLQIDVDENEELCNQFRISSIPAVFIIKDGVVKSSFVGYRLKREIKPMIDSVL